MKTGIQTAVGVLEGGLIPTFHINWFTYGYTLEQGMVGLDGVVEAAAGKPLEMLESPNDTDYSVDISTKAVLGKHESDVLEKCFRTGGFECYYLRIVMQDLVNKDVLPAGRYIVRFSY
jgi:hypothetical protein